MIYKNNNFGSYQASYTTAEDVSAIQSLIESKDLLPPSKREAVYRREKDVLTRNISSGLFFKIERVAISEEEFNALGRQSKKIIGITGAYLLNVGNDGLPQKIPTETARNRQRIESRTVDIGTTLVIHDNDIPNADGLLPKRCFFKLLVAATTLNLVRLVGQKIEGQNISFDTITASVQNRVEMQTIMNWLTHKTLGWNLIERPSRQLIDATSITTGNDPTFQSHDKFYYELSPCKLPTSASYLLDCWENDRVTSDHDFGKHTAHIDIQFDEKMVAFLRAVKEGAHFLSNNSQAGFEYLRSRLPFSQPSAHEPTGREFTPNL